MQDVNNAEKSVQEIIQFLPREEFVNSQIIFEDAQYVEGTKSPRQVLPSRRSVQKMVEALELNEGSRVLHIGTGFGFTALVLSVAAGEVISLERLHHRADFARDKMERFGRTNITILEGEDSRALEIEGMFDAILVETSSGDVPEALMDKLEVGGVMVVPRGVSANSMELTRYRRNEQGVTLRESLGSFRLLPTLDEILLDLGVVDEDRVEQIRNLSKTKRISIANALMKSADLDEMEIYRALALQRGIKLARTSELVPLIEDAALDMVPRTFLKHQKLVPITLEAEVLQVATPDPDVDLSTLRAAIDCEEVSPILVTRTDYRRLWRAIDLGQYGPQIDHEPAQAWAAENEEYQALELQSSSKRKRIQALLDGILVDAVAERASDIHFERYDDWVRIRFRIDGECVDMDRYKITPQELAGIINVIKIGSDLNIAERRRPQGGRMERVVGGKGFDLLIQVQPAHHGEYVVIRLLPRDNRMISIEELGFPPHLSKIYRRQLLNPSGMLLVVGPTGSGKSTTLYGGLQLLADDTRRKVITAEDPVEYSIKRVQQTQIQASIGFTFANAMRSFVRQDPDVILVGEIRDTETALEAIRASQTGHLLLSTLHANDSVDAVQRLFDLDMDPNSVASELSAIIAQRLPRRICDHCRKPATPEPEIAEEVFPNGIPEGFECFEGEGCTRCNHRGTRGRIAVVEMLKVDATVRKAIADGMQVDRLREVCLDAGLYTMRSTALSLIQDGVIAFKELRQILPDDRMGPERESDLG